LRSSRSRPNGGADHPTSTVPTSCRESGRIPVGASFAAGIFLDEGGDDAMRGAIGRIGDGPPIGVAQGLDRGFGPTYQNRSPAPVIRCR
jgi:hypothetical protein